MEKKGFSASVARRLRRRLEKPQPTRSRGSATTHKAVGFTLIELLVVISIIGILASLAMVSYSGAQKQTRDTQRRSDLGQYRNGLETYAASNNSSYPSRDSAIVAKTMCTSDLQPNGFMSSCPADPLGTGTYIYYYLSDGTGGGTADAANYMLYSGLETGGYWVLCSNGESFNQTDAPGSSDCGFTP